MPVTNLATDRDLARKAVEWLARLPFLGMSELTMLLGVAENRTESTLAELEETGWCEWIATSSPELGASRLYVLTRAATDRLAESQSSKALPLPHREILARLVRLETTAGLNRFLAELATAKPTADDIDAVLTEARSLPWLASRTGRWWAPAVEAYACMRWGPWVAPFLVAWDRADAPPIHRRKRVGGWYAHAESQHWDTPPIFVVCPGEREAEQWARAVTNSADRRGCPLLSVFLSTTLPALADPRGAIWRRVDGSPDALLRDRMRWVPEGTEPFKPEKLKEHFQLTQLPAARTPLRDWAATFGNQPNVASRSERMAALSLATGPLQKTMLEWVGHHALLSPRDLSSLMGIREPLAEKLLSGLADRELAQQISPADGAVPVIARYVLTAAGLHLLAARDGVPPRRYARYGVLAAPNGGKTSHRLETLVRQFEHTVGTNSFFVRLKWGLYAAGGRLLRWLNSSEATLAFMASGGGHWLRPDGYAEIELNGRAHGLFLEWDRGTVRRRDPLKEKFKCYAAYYRTQANPVDLLIVTVSPRREAVIWDIVRSAFGGQGPLRVFTSIDSLVERIGPLGNAWRSAAGSSRMSWPRHATLV